MILISNKEHIEKTGTLSRTMFFLTCQESDKSKTPGEDYYQAGLIE